MAVKTAAALKAQFEGRDPKDHNTDLIDTIGDPAILPAASATAAGKVELATNAEAKTGTDTERAVTAANVRAVLTGLKFISFDGINGAGACTATGAAVGDKVLYVAGLTESALGNASAAFEATITVINQVQQSSVSNLSANNYLAVLLAVA